MKMLYHCYSVTVTRNIKVICIIVVLLKCVEKAQKVLIDNLKSFHIFFIKNHKLNEQHFMLFVCLNIKIITDPKMLAVIAFPEYCCLHL